MTRRLLTLPVAALSDSALALCPIPKPTVEQLLDHIAASISPRDQTQLSSVVADERFEQRVGFTPRAYSRAGCRRPTTSGGGWNPKSGSSGCRVGSEWLGFRDVRKINGRALTQRKSQPWPMCWPPTPM